MRAMNAENAGQRRPRITRRGLVRNGIHLMLGTLLSEQWATAVEPRWFEVESVEMPLPRLNKAFDGYRMAQLSDIHLGDGLNQARLDYIVEKTNALHADAIVLTGDFVSSRAELQEAKLAHSLKRLSARDGVFAVLGNHDHWGGAKYVRRALRDAGVRELRNDVHILRRGGAQTFLVGADCPGEGKADIAHVVTQLPAQSTAILLAHEPDFADEFSLLGRFDLQLSGHSHAGQVCLPLLGPILLPRYGKKYSRGLYKVNDMLLYTNRGVGSSGIPVRFNCRPEISLFTLRTV
jgi:hypothetical protein